MPFFQKKPQHYVAMFALFFLVWAAAMEIGLRMMGFEGVALYESSADGFYRMRPGTAFMDGGRTNAFGLRGPIPEPVELVVLGDSVVFGTGLRTEQTIPARLAERSGLKVLNGGVPGYGAREPGQLVEHVLRTLGPRLYIELLTANDVTEATTEPASLPFWVDLREKHSAVRLYEFGVLLRHFWEIYKIRHWTGYGMERWTHRITDGPTASAWVTSRMGELAKGLPEGSKLVVFLSPFRSEAAARPRDPWLRDFDKAAGSGGGYRRLADDLARGGLDVVELKGPAFAGSGSDAFADDIHFTPKGADEIARLMWLEIKPRLSDGLPAPGPRPEPRSY